MDCNQARGKVNRILTEYQAFSDLKEILDVAAAAENSIAALTAEEQRLQWETANLRGQMEQAAEELQVAKTGNKVALEALAVSLKAKEKVAAGKIDAIAKAIDAADSTHRDLLQKQEQEKAEALELLRSIRISVMEEDRKYKELKDAIAALKATL